MENLLRVIAIVGRRGGAFRTLSSSRIAAAEGKKTEPVADEEPGSLEKLNDTTPWQREKRDLIQTPQKIAEQEAKARARYELDVPPVEEKRHKVWKSRPTRSINKSLVRTDFFESIRDKNKESFIAVCEMFSERDAHLRGHVEFIYAALSQMRKFRVNRDLESYKKLIDIFPKGQMISTNMFQVEFMHYPKQQQCGVDILEQMEDNGVIPDIEVQRMFTNIFGSQSFPIRKAGRMLYWMPKFKHLSPFPALPDPLPDDNLLLAKLAIERITQPDLSTKIDVYQGEDLEEAVDPTWIVSGQSEEQKALIEAHPRHTPIYVEGAFRVWLQRVCINYFVLRAEPRPPKPQQKQQQDDDDVSQIKSELLEESALEVRPSVHEQDDGIILGVCATGTSSKDSLLSWIRFLGKTNPRLGSDIPVLFTLKSPIGPTDNLEIPSFQEMESQKYLENSNNAQSSSDAESGFATSSGGHLGLNPCVPNVAQMGVWSESESVFPNWPHAHHPPSSSSARNLADNLALLDELEAAKKEAAVSAPKLNLEQTPPENSKRLK